MIASLEVNCIGQMLAKMHILIPLTSYVGLILCSKHRLIKTQIGHARDFACIAAKARPLRA